MLDVLGFLGCDDGLVVGDHVVRAVVVGPGGDDLVVVVDLGAVEGRGEDLKVLVCLFEEGSRWDVCTF